MYINDSTKSLKKSSNRYDGLSNEIVMKVLMQHSLSHMLVSVLKWKPDLHPSESHLSAPLVLHVSQFSAQSPAVNKKVQIIVFLYMW